MSSGAEATRLASAYSGDPNQRWVYWGPYLSERQWGTVREDYSPDGNAWNYLPHADASSRAYRWGEDGLAGISDDKQRLCFALALWNGQDSILKERLFGLTNPEGNHGEDVKEYYFFLDNTPTHSWMRWQYKYPQRAFPYENLREVNAQRKASDPHAFEYELVDTGVFSEGRYFDVEVTYAKAGPTDVCIRISVTNRGPDAAPLDVLPTLWFRNQWSWSTGAARPLLAAGKAGDAATIHAQPPTGTSLDYGAEMMLYCQGPDQLLFVDNDSNRARLWRAADSPPYPKDGIHTHIISGASTVNPAQTGTKAAARWHRVISAGETVVFSLRLSSEIGRPDAFGGDFEATFNQRSSEADAYWAALTPAGLSADQANILRQAYAGMLWSKQFYYYVVSEWLDGDPGQPPPPAGRVRNQSWRHFYSSNILTMPDTWEYPWFAAWDLCFQSVVFSRIDPTFAKNQLLILAREWFMAPSGAVPAYEWAFDDVNPPLHAWAALRIFEIEQEMTGGSGDITFLENIFRYCLMYFTWWANRKDIDGKDLFGGGFLGLDNISILNRSNLSQVSEQVGRALELLQSDGTSWMGMFSLNLMDIAMRLSETGKPEYSRLAAKFLQHFVFITDAINGEQHRGEQNLSMWDDTDGFYYDILKVVGTNPQTDPDQYLPVKLRSLVGVIALFPGLIVDVTALEQSTASFLMERLRWFMGQHPELLGQALVSDAGGSERRLLTFVEPDRLRRILARVLDESEMLGPYGVRSLSKAHQKPAYQLSVNGVLLSEQYEPAESANQSFGGNSNWRGPVWFPINFLLIESLMRYYRFLGDSFTVELPTGSGQQATLLEVANNLRSRLVAHFERGADGRRPVFGGTELFQTDPNWRDNLLFYEYFHGDNGAGIGASHQTGWTGLVVELLRGVNG